LSPGHAGRLVKLLIEKELGKLVDQNSGSWNRIAGWLRQLDLVRSAV
jgi:hypothetical protein